MSALSVLWLVGCPSSSPPRFDGLPPGSNTRITSEDPNFGASLASGDFDADGEIDLAISGFGVTSVFSGPFDGDLASTDASSELFGDNVASGDLDGDGTPEIVTRGTENSCHPTVHVYAGEEQATLEVRNSSIRPPLLAIAEVNDAPGAEIVIGAAGYECLGEDSGAKLVLFAADASGALSSETDALSILPAAFSAEAFDAIDLADLSGDGRPDLLTSFIGFNHADESYLHISPLPEGDFEAAADTVFDNTRTRFAGDIDGDGHGDVGMPAYESLRFYAGPFGEPSPGEPYLRVESFNTPQRVEIRPAGDMDGDGADDLLLIDPPLLITALFYGPIASDAEPDLMLRLTDDGVLGFTDAIVVPDIDENGTPELLLGAAGDLAGEATGTVWLLGLPWEGPAG